MSETIVRDLNDMAVFVAVAEMGSLTRAADYLDMPKSNISRRLARLEERLSLRLLERNTRSLRLTEAGTLYLRHCQRMVQAAEEADQCMDYELEIPRGIIRITAPVTLGQQLVASLLPRYLQENPQMRAELMLSNQPVDLRHEAIDLAVQAGPLPDSSLMAQRIGQCTLHLYASHAYIQAFGEPQHPVELAQHRCLTMGTMTSPDQWLLFNKQEQAEVRVVPLVTVNDFMSLQLLVKQGTGIGLLPDYFCTKQAQNDTSLKRILGEWALAPTQLYAVYPSPTSLTPKTKVFVELLKQALHN